MLHTQSAIAWAEKRHKKKIVIPKKPENTKASKIPFLNLGPDADILTTNANLAEAETQHGHKMSTPKNETIIPRDYFVPNFGEDKDILATKQHLAKAEKKLKKKFDWDQIKVEANKTNGYPKNYKVQNLGMDRDIIDS